MTTLRAPFAAVLLLLLGGPAPAAAQTAAGSAAYDPARVAMKAVDRGLEYLARTQEDDGGWPSPRYGKNVGVSALATLAFLGRGHTPGRGPYAECLERATGFLLANCDDKGVVAVKSGGAPPMYQHGLGTLALAELYGMSRRPDIRARLENAVGLIVRTQNNAGGWRYQPVKADADMSVTVMQIVALKAAMNAGIKVPQSAIDQGVKYVKASACKDGGFGYTPGGGPTAGASPAGTLSLQMCGEFDAPQVQAGLAYLSRQHYAYGQGRFFYAIYYAAQAMNQAGGSHWVDWMPRMRASLLGNQAPDGQWPPASDSDAGGAGPAFSTAISCLVLSIDCHYLPIYER